MGLSARQLLLFQMVEFLLQNFNFPVCLVEFLFDCFLLLQYLFDLLAAGLVDELYLLLEVDEVGLVG